jgi:hypothetical protein
VGESRELLKEGACAHLEGSERVADAEVTMDDLQCQLQAYLPQDFMPAPGIDSLAAFYVSHADAMEAARHAAIDAAFAAADPPSRRSIELVDDDIVDASAARYPERFRGEKEKQCSVLRDIFGNPFRRVQIEPGLRAGSVVKLASAAYADRGLPSGLLDTTRLAILADALEETGCTNADILNHCRSPGPHVRGCWVVDLLLGKE